MRKQTISNLQLRIGILEDRLACMPSATHIGSIHERTLIEEQIERLQKEIKKEAIIENLPTEERRAYDEFLRLTPPN